MSVRCIKKPEGHTANNTSKIRNSEIPLTPDDYREAAKKADKGGNLGAEATSVPISLLSTSLSLHQLQVLPFVW